MSRHEVPPRESSLLRRSGALALRVIAVTALAVAGCHCGQQHKRAASGDTQSAQPDAATQLPQKSLVAVWGSGAKDVWAVGDAGTILHYDGKAWKAADGGTTKSLLGVAGSGPDDVWAVGEDATTLHFDGKTWTQTSAPTESTEGMTLLGVWASSKTQAWVAGVDESIGVLRHFTGKTWEIAPISASTSLWEAWGVGSNDVWMVGSDNKGAGKQGFVLRGDGTHFDRMPFEGASLRAVGGTSSDDVWMGAYTGELYHWDGTAWSATPAIQAESHLLAIWAAAKNDVWAVGFDGLILHYDGTSWTRSSTKTQEILWSVWGSSAKDVWVVGNNGTRLHWDGRDWKG
jgi:hypothetical protein